MANNFLKVQISNLEKAINYQFKNPNLIEEALSHPSLKQQETQDQYKDYERLELLGDSLLGFLITEILFNKFSAYDEGNIAKIKAYLVSQDILCKVATKIDLASYIIMTKGEESSGGRINPSNKENSLEALLAAIYLDSNIENVRILVNNLWLPYLDNVNFSAIDPKTYLQEWSQSNKYGMPIYDIINKEGPVHSPKFTVKVTVGSTYQIGSGRSIKLAEKQAAKKLLNELNSKK